VIVFAVFLYAVLWWSRCDQRKPERWKTFFQTPVFAITSAYQVFPQGATEERHPVGKGIGERDIVNAR
jgi:hypothetical protein